MSDVTADASVSERDPRVDRAMRLFQFLARAQQLKSKPSLTVEAQVESGHLLWFSDLPEHPAVSPAHRVGAPSPNDPILVIDRLPRVEPPKPSDSLASWLVGRTNDPVSRPELGEYITVVEPEQQMASKVTLDDRPDVAIAYQQWIERWNVWAEHELRDRPVRDLYGKVFATHVAAASHTEELELVLGIGCLAWRPHDHPAVKRHMLTAPVAIHLDDDTGQLSVRQVESPGVVAVELDMLDPSLLPDPQLVNEIKTTAGGLECHALDRDEIGTVIRRLAHSLDAHGQYRDEDAAPEIGAYALASFAPVMVLRRRSQQGITAIFQTIVGQLDEAAAVPDGMLPLIDPDHRPQDSHEAGDGALLRVDEEPFLPLAVNDTQLRIIRDVDRQAQTLVQGPPGTGKTHTAAALLSHLLAQGKRVLVTAHTDRALREVRDKLPAEIQPLSVAVVGSSREDMADLKLAVERISMRAAAYDEAESTTVIQHCLDTVEALRRQRAVVYRQLVEAREHEIRVHERDGYSGTLATIAQQHAAETEQYSWLTEHVTVPSDGKPPLSTREIMEWHELLTDQALHADEPQAQARLIDLTAIPQPNVFADLVESEARTSDADQRHFPLKEHAAFDAVSRLAVAVRLHLQQRLHQLAESADALARRREPWLDQALYDVHSGRASTWRARAHQLGDLIDDATAHVHNLDPITQVDVSGDPAPLIPLANSVFAHLNGGGKIKAAPDSMPKIGAFTPKPIKQAEALFEQVRVHGLPPVSTEQLTAFLEWYKATTVLDAIDRAWPDSIRIPAEDTLHERLQWHVTELGQLHSVLRLAADLETEERRLAELGLPRPDWNDLAAVRRYARLVDAAAAADARTAATEPLQTVEDTLTQEARWSDAARTVQEILLAVRERDHDAYSAAHARIGRLQHVRLATARRDELAGRLCASAAGLRAAIEQEPDGPQWAERLSGFERAWAWASVGAWIRQKADADVNSLQASVINTETEIRNQVQQLTAARAWGHAVAPNRITGRARAHLQQYAYLVGRLGKGTGTFAAQRRADIRRAMDRCRPAVPVWIMPIYRIAEQLEIQPDMFDVVIVDEASQAGLEATFLQYLAPKLLVIGDDKQVSPAAVGVDEQQLRDLANQYLADEPFKDVWQDPKRSFFDEARMRYSGLITLTEHRRCVPEIIGFSNRIAYEPAGIRLVPVRQYGVDRLDPVKCVFLPKGHVVGAAAKINPVEVEAIVAQIEKCIVDPRYDGKTFGVISLLGSAQARRIETALLARGINPQEWSARELRCGDAADFQGSERDVMFLSMVIAPEPDRRITARAQVGDLQRYNVAASRAKDQLWVFHSVALSDLNNKEDMRFQLLDYCYGVANRANVEDGAVTTAVPEDVRTAPFDSLFEQRVFNRLVDRGYTVFPQFEVEHYRIDLVVLGGKARLAVECDGDAWHGPDAYEKDLARQRDLERCGWTFFRIRESDFYVDRVQVLDDLWAALDQLDIHPSGWTQEEPTASNASEFPTDQTTITPVAPAEGHPSTPTSPAANPEMITRERLEEASTESEELVEAGNTYTEVAEPAGLPDYREFSGSLTPVADATASQLLDGVRDIVELEGPVLGDRLMGAYVKASGGRRVGRQIGEKLEAAIDEAVRRGLLIQDDPLAERDPRSYTYLLPNQPWFVVRDLGPRSLESVPPLELAATVATVADDNGWDNETRLYRATLQRLGLKRLTTNAEIRLESVLPLARQQRGRPVAIKASPECSSPRET